MAKKTTSKAEPQSAEPLTQTPELDRSALPADQATSSRPRAAKKPASGRAKAAPTRAAKAPTAGTAKADTPRPARAKRPAAARVSNDIQARPPRVERQLPTQALEQTQTPAPVPPPETVSDEDVRMRAYFLSLERGPHGGGEMDFWLQAERELRPKGRR